MSHQHKTCKHVLKFCESCDTVFCTRCDKEWKFPPTYWTWTYPYSYGTTVTNGGYPASSGNVTTLVGACKHASQE